MADSLQLAAFLEDPEMLETVVDSLVGCWRGVAVKLSKKHSDVIKTSWIDAVKNSQSSPAAEARAFVDGVCDRYSRDFALALGRSPGPLNLSLAEFSEACYRAGLGRLACRLDPTVEARLSRPGISTASLPMPVSKPLYSS